MQNLTIVCKYSELPVLEHLTAAFTVVGENAIFWWQNNKPVFDMMHEHEPDILICEGSQLTNSMVVALTAFEHTKLVLINPMDKVNKKCQLERVSPGRIFSCYTKTPKIEIPGLEVIKPYANTAQIRGGTYVEELSSDILIYTDNDSIVDYKVLATVTQSLYNFQVKIFGKNRINIPYYLGELSYKDMSNAIASAKIAIDFGDHYMDFAANKLYTFTHFDNPVWANVDYDKYGTELGKLLHEDKLRNKLVKKAHKMTNGNTIFNRAGYILEKLGYLQNSVRLMEHV